jgi:regulatory protein
MDFLARREYAREELQKRLHKAGFGLAEVRQAVESLIEDGLQSDDRFCESFIRHRVGQAYGPRRIRAELIARGVDGPMVDLHLRNFEVDWFEVAELAWRRRFGESPSESFKDKAKRHRYLSYRGFEHQQIEHAAAVCPRDDEST